jgi:hypothetical protein
MHFRMLTAAGRLVCRDPKCQQKAVYVCETLTNGGFDRTAHFRAEHDKKCSYFEDPREAARIDNFRKALREGRSILVNINIDKTVLGTGKLKDEFNAHSGLYGPDITDDLTWKAREANKGYFAVPAHDIGDVLFYLRMAQQFTNETGAEGLSLLHFNNRRIVMPYKEFVVSNEPSPKRKVPTVLLRDIVERAGRRAFAMRKAPSYIKDLPRLYMFKASEQQISKADDSVLHTLFGRLVTTQLPVDANGTTFEQEIKPGLLIKSVKGEPLNNRTLLEEGHDMWVLGRATLSRSNALGVSARIYSHTKLHARTVFLMVSIRDRVQYKAIDAKGMALRTKIPTQTSSQPKGFVEHAWMRRRDLA